MPAVVVLIAFLTCQNTFSTKHTVKTSAAELKNIILNGSGEDGQ